MEKKEFRLNCKRFFLTYPKTKELENKDQVLKAILEKCRTIKANPLEVMVSFETGKKKTDSKNYEHFHAYVCLDRRANIRYCHFWDLLEVHGHYKSAGRTWGRIRAVKRYIAKDGEVARYKNNELLVSPEVDTPLKGNDMVTLVSFLKQEHEKGRSMAEIYPKLGEKAQAMMMLHKNRINNLIFKPTNHYNNFNFNLVGVKEDLEAWKQLMFEKTLFLWGRSGSGKTSLAKSFFEYPLVVTCRESFKSLEHWHDGIIMDDVTWKELSKGAGGQEEAIIKLIDIEHDRDVDVKYGKVKLPRRMPRVITTNKSPIQWFGYVKEGVIPKEIERRIMQVEVTKDMRKIPEENKQ